jgi:hypothetical protein
MLTAMLALALALSLTAAPVDPVRCELDGVAARIEQLKARRMAGEDVGRELWRLLVRAQELAAQLEKDRPAAPLPPAPPGADELREGADALHDEVDRLARELAALDGRIAAERGAAVQPVPVPATTGVAAGEPAAVRALREERAKLAGRLEALRAAAEALESEARAAEREP